MLTRRRFLQAATLVGLLFVTGLSFAAAPATYYVDCAADGDAGTGLTTAANVAWKTVAKVSASSFAAGDSILFKRGCTWREQLTVPSSGSAGSPITFGAYGTGADPIVDGANLIAPGSSWAQTATWYSTSAFTDWSDLTGEYPTENRNIVNADVFSQSGTKIRLTLKAHSTNASTFDHVTIGLCTTGDVFDAAPTVVTFNTGSASVVIAGGGTAVSDEITFAYDKTKRYAVHISQDAKNTQLGWAGWYTYYAFSANQSETLDFAADGGQNGTASFSKLEVYNATANVWQTALTTEPKSVWFDGVKGYNRASTATLLAQHEWWWSGNVLYIFSASDPDTAFTSPGIEANQRAYGITSAVDYILVQNLDVKNALTANIRLTASDNSIIENCTIHHGTLDGILVASTSEANVIRRCDIHSNGANGINFSSAANTAPGNAAYYNKIRNNILDGVKIANTQTSGFVYNNVIHNNQQHGVNNVAAENWTLKNNILSKNGGYQLNASATSAITHSNNAYWKSNGDLVSYNDTAYSISDIATFEATSVSANPLQMDQKLSEPGHVDQTTDGSIVYAGYITTIRKSTDGGATWTTIRTIPGAVGVVTVFVATNGYLYYSGYTSDDTERGLWRTVDSGANWTRVIDLSALADTFHLANVVEDSEGRLFAALYHLESEVKSAKVYRSTNNGATWAVVYEPANPQHTHQLVCSDDDTIWGFVGDAVAPYSDTGIIKSTDHGDNWTLITTNPTAMIIPFATSTYRLWGAELDDATVYYTTGEVTYQKVLSATNGGMIWWFRKDASTGYIYLGTVAAAASTSAFIYVSKDAGLTWEILRSFPITAQWLGILRGSRIVNSIMYVTVDLSAGAYILKMDLSKNDTFTLSSASPARDAGVDVGLTTDFAGSTVPKGAGVDIGAYEFWRKKSARLIGPIPGPILSPLLGKAVD